jgi:hypothetical protein
MNKIIFRINKLYYYIFGEKFFKKLNFEWHKYPSRYNIIQETIIRKKYKNYLEIGCFDDEVFSKIIIEKKIGVDPEKGGTVRDTSDNFFKFNNIKFDIIFIDGLHHYEQVKKDIENSLLCLNNGGVIFLHDCMPESCIRQTIPRCSRVWNGDVWKNIVEARTNVNLDTYVCIADHGVGIILKRPNRNLLRVNVKNFSRLRFKDFYYNYKKYLNLVTNDNLKNIF